MGEFFALLKMFIILIVVAVTQLSNYRTVPPTVNYISIREEKGGEGTTEAAA